MIIQPRSKKAITGYTEQTIGGWSVKTYSNGEKVASVGLDYVENTDFEWTGITTAYFQENLPGNLFSNVSECSAVAIDITPNVPYKNSIEIATKELFGDTATSKICIKPCEHLWGDANYGIPTKIHIVWTVRGI